MPTALRRIFSGPTGSEALGCARALRSLDSLLRKPDEMARAELVTRWLYGRPFSLAALVAVEFGEDGPRSGEILAGRTGRMDTALLTESLGSTLSPLQSPREGRPLWISLKDDPLRPGTALLRKLSLSCALVLPLRPDQRGGSLRGRFLMLGAVKPLDRQDTIIQELLAAWSIYRLVTEPGWETRLAGGPGGDTGWPGVEAWLQAPAALALVNRNRLLLLNAAAERLLRETAGREGEAAQTWLMGAVCRLLEAGQDRETVMASQTRRCNLEVALGPELAGQGLRLVALRDATAETLADTRQAETISTLSHELRTPLASMKSSLGLVLRGEAGELTGPQQRFLAMTMRNIDRLDRLIGDLLDVSRAAAGQLALRRELTDLGPLLREAVEMLAASARARNITLDHAGLPESFPAHVDADKVVQMVLNTVGNSLKYTEEGGLVRLALSARPAELPALTTAIAERYFLPLRTFSLVVEDNGIGMSRQVLEDLYRPFRRGEEAEESRAPGSGLGLHITRGLVDAHGGLIEINSAKDMGTTVWIILPRDPESERVLRGGRDLAEALRAGGDELRLAFLDVRRPDRQPGDRELHEAADEVLVFAKHLEGGGFVQEEGSAAPGGADVPLMSLAPGLWGAVLREWARLDAAWEIVEAKPDLPAVLAGAKWQVFEPRDGSTPRVRDAGSVLAGPGRTGD
jgi:signal transduction histidine kinase